MSRREQSQVSLKSDKKNDLFSWNTKFWPSLAEVIFQTGFLSIFKAVFSTKCSRKSDEEWDSSLWWPLWTWFSCFEAVVCLEGVLTCGEVKKNLRAYPLILVNDLYIIGCQCFLSIPLEQIWSWWSVSGKQTESTAIWIFRQSRFSCLGLCCRWNSPGLRLLPWGCHLCCLRALGVDSCQSTTNNSLKEGCSNMCASNVWKTRFAFLIKLKEVS